MHSQHMFNECIARTEQARGSIDEDPRLEYSSPIVDKARQTTVHNLEGALTDLPAADAEKEADHIGLLLLRQLLEVLEGTHLVCANSQISTSSPTNSRRKIEVAMN